MGSGSAASNSSDEVHSPRESRKPNSIQSFLSTVGKSQSRARSSVIPLNIADKLSVYRSLAMREYNDIVEKGKEHHVFSFWQRHQSQLKCLASLARKHLITPATSVPSESAFSVASFLGRKERSRLSPHNLAQLAFLKDKMDDGT